jgi:transposase-like protein
MAQRKRHTAEFKAKVALEAMREQKTANQIAAEYEVSPSQISQWKKQAQEHLVAAFTAGGVTAIVRDDEGLKEKLYSQIGQLKVENDWLKKKSTLLG